MEARFWMQAAMTIRHFQRNGINCGSLCLRHQSTQNAGSHQTPSVISPAGMNAENLAGMLLDYYLLALIDWLLDWSVGWSIDCLIGRLADRLIDWLISTRFCILFFKNLIGPVDHRKTQNTEDDWFLHTLPIRVGVFELQCLIIPALLWQQSIATAHGNHAWHSGNGPTRETQQTCRPNRLHDAIWFRRMIHRSRWFGRGGSSRTRKRANISRRCTSTPGTFRATNSAAAPRCRSSCRFIRKTEWNYKRNCSPGGYETTILDSVRGSTATARFNLLTSRADFFRFTSTKFVYYSDFA